ncbi:hypothetical protein RUM44_000855 [Polyplax serrata]|uniref:Uncharacterized protein n=1 Tax=Polyplax serrata TaxID=468196 RepID=A0ABR1B8S8_POLSC
MGNQTDQSDEKINQANPNEDNSSKEYVVDQIFCGDNLTIYAIFEVEDDMRMPKKNGSTEGSNSEEEVIIISEEMREDLEESCIKLLEDFALMLKEEEKENCQQKKADNSDLIKQDDIKVLYRKETPPSSQNLEEQCVRVEKTSKGINTDLTFCPKLLEEVQNTIGTNFPNGNPAEKLEDICMSISRKISSCLLESSSTTSSCSVSSLEMKENENTEVKKSLSNFVVCPMVVTNEGILRQKQIEDHKLMERKEMTSKCTPELPKDTTTSPSDSEINNGGEISGVKTTHFDKIVLSKQSTEKDDTISSECRKKCKKLSKQAILEEIKTVQWKLNSIVQCLESNVLELDSCDLDLPRDLIKKVINKISDEFISPEGKENDSIKRQMSNLALPEPKIKKTHGGLPACCGKTPNVCPDAVKDTVNAKLCEVADIKSMSSMSTASTSNTFSLKNTVKNSPVLHVENILFFNLEKPVNNCGNICQSKSDSKIWLKTKVKYQIQNLKKTQSLQEKLEILCNKKLKTLSIKPESNAMARTYPIPGNTLPETLNLDKCEMGDDEVKGKKSKADVEKDVELVAKMMEENSEDISKKENFKFKQKMAVQERCRYRKCENANFSTTRLESKKIGFQRMKTTESKPNRNNCISQLGKNNQLKRPPDTRKMINEKQKSSVSSPAQVLSDLRKDVKGVRRTPSRREIVKTVKKERSTGLTEQVKHKRLSRTIRSVGKDNPDSKLHIDKLVKDPKEKFFFSEPENLLIGPKGTPGGTQNVKLADKVNRLASRPPTQKHRRDPAAAPVPLNKAKEKSVTRLPQKCCRSYKESLEKIMEKKKTDHVLVFDKKIDNVYFPVTKSPEPEQDAAPVVIELFSKKPASLETFNSDFTSGEPVNFKSSTSNVHLNDSYMSNSGNSDIVNSDLEKAVIKSVWALTKVLLYGNGTRSCKS